MGRSEQLTGMGGYSQKDTALQVDEVIDPEVDDLIERVVEKGGSANVRDLIEQGFEEHRSKLETMAAIKRAVAYSRVVPRNGLYEIQVVGE